MMLDLLKKRKSTREFLDKDIPKETIEAIVEAGLRSPSSKNRRPWHFTVCQNKEDIQQLAKAREHGLTFLEKAPVAIVVSADPSLCDVWIEDCSIAAILMQLTIEDFGLGSCWGQIRNRQKNADQTASEYVKTHLDMDGDHEVLCIIGLGYKKSDQLHDEKVTWRK